MSFLKLSEKVSEAQMQARFVEIEIESIQDRISGLDSASEEANRARSKMYFLRQELAEREHDVRLAEAQVDWFLMGQKK
jgi:uncharacterized protein YPO0396